MLDCKIKCKPIVLKISYVLKWAIDGWRGAEGGNILDCKGAKSWFFWLRVIKLLSLNFTKSLETLFSNWSGLSKGATERLIFEDFHVHTDPLYIESVFQFLIGELFCEVPWLTLNVLHGWRLRLHSLNSLILLFLRYLISLPIHRYLFAFYRNVHRTKKKHR